MKTRMFFAAASILSISTLSALHPNVMFQDALDEFNDRMESMRENPAPGQQIKIRDLAQVVGEEKVKLTGWGVVTGLNGTGDGSDAAVKMLLQIAERQGIRIDIDDIESGNVALVTVSAEINPHERNYDVAVKSVGDAKSLQNGFLEGSTLTPIGSTEIFGVASGPLALGARYFAAQPAGGAVGAATSVTVGHPTMAFVINGGQLVRNIPSARIEGGQITFFLNHPENRTSTNVANVINHYMKEIGISAQPTNASTITVYLDEQRFGEDGNLTRLIADIGDLPVEISRKATITIDQGAGVIAMTGDVKLEEGSIAVSGLTVTVSSDITPVTRQGFTDGETSFYDIPELTVSEDQANFLTLPPGTDLRKVQETFNALKLTPTSIISVLNAMHRAGMIHADIVVIPR